MCANFPTNQTFFLAQIFQKMDFVLEIQRISIVQIPCMPILRQNGQLRIVWHKFAQKWI